jgi:phosphoglycerate dehydrogenase-like enzyme
MKILFVTPLSEEKKDEFKMDGVEILYKDRNEVTKEDLQDVEAVLGNLPYAMLKDVPSLKWVQLDSAGVNGMTQLPETVQLTNASGAYGEAISEHMLAAVLAMMKNLYPIMICRRNMPGRTWVLSIPFQQALSSLSAWETLVLLLPVRHMP